MSATKSTAVKPLTKADMRRAIKMLEASRAEHERLWYSNRDARFRMDTRFAYESLQEKYEIAMNTLRYCSNRECGVALKALFEIPTEDK